jgi:hypothetical protein
MAVKHIDPTLLKEALEKVDTRIEILLTNLSKGVDVKMESIVTMFEVRDILRKEQFARP